MAPKKQTTKRGKPAAQNHNAAGDANNEQSDAVTLNKNDAINLNETYVKSNINENAANDAENEIEKDENDVDDAAKVQNGKNNDQGSDSPNSNSDEANDSPKRVKKVKAAPKAVSKTKPEKEQESSGKFLPYEIRNVSFEAVI